MVSGTLKARRCNFTPQIQAVWISATSAVVSLYDCTFSAGDRTGTTEEDEFIYDLQKAPVGHLPLTSTLRGTQLLVNLLDSEVWEWDEFKQD